MVYFETAYVNAFRLTFGKMTKNRNILNNTKKKPVWLIWQLAQGPCTHCGPTFV